MDYCAIAYINIGFPLQLNGIVDRGNHFTTRIVRFIAWFRILCAKPVTSRGEMEQVANPFMVKSFQTKTSNSSIRELEPWAWQILESIQMVLSSSFVLPQRLGWMENMLSLGKSYQAWMSFLPLNKLEATRARPKWQSWFLIVDNYNKYVDMQICCFILWSKKYVPGLSPCVSIATALYAYLILWWVCPTRNNPKWPKQVVPLILSLGFHSSRPISSVKTECNKRYFVNTLSGELQHTLHFFNPKD